MAGLILPGAGNDGPDHLLIELAPDPHRGAQRDLFVLLVVQIGAVFVEQPIFHGGVPVGDHPDAGFQEFLG